ncbi:hypothetical protein AKO1_009348 [Acrasis kona]|uniref:CRAL-TRIO domain-containing protein n=1 Tax=Acrasis kona TaxID=1008807 RepID=A0AAW2ZKK1_9EUKA
MSSASLYGEIPSGVTSPIQSLNEEQRAKLEQFKEIVASWPEDLIEDKAQADEMAMYRYLLGLQWQLDVASNHLKETLEWRKTFRPQDLRAKDFESVAKQGWCYHYGFDRQSRPIIFLKMGRDTAPDTEENRLLKYKYLAYVQEKCISRMPPGVYNITWVVDLHQANVTLAMCQNMKDMFVKLGDHYTERLARVYVMNLGWGLSMIWSFIKPFLAKSTVEKYNIIKGNDKHIAEEIAKGLDPAQTPKEFFGQVDYNFDIQKIIDEESK